RPCIILEMEWGDRVKAYYFLAAPISNNHELESETPLKSSIVSPTSSLSYSSQAIVPTKPDWQFKQSYCYAFKRLTKFYCLPSQVNLRANVLFIGLQTIIKSLTPPRNPDPFASLHDAESPDPDTRNDAKLRTGDIKLYAHISTLTSTGNTGVSVDWNSTRGWFDESAKAPRYYDQCNGHSWSHASYTQASEGSETDVSDSYYEEDFEEWEAQQERDRSLTLAIVLEEKCDQPTDGREGLAEIELIERLSWGLHQLTKLDLLSDTSRAPISEYLKTIP
ncbi:hypothetical protein B0J17DRAFT_735150, partial [Rhizoctonia solani]